MGSGIEMTKLSARIPMQENLQEDLQEELREEIQEEIHMPGYMQYLDSSNFTYGTLKYDKRSNKWVIKGEPIVCQMAKRLFPGCDSGRRGTAKFSAHKRIIGDLNWLMLRYPLEIVSREKWEKDFDEARNYVLERERINKEPLKITPSEITFRGELREFQKEGVGFLLQNSRALLADEMGLGKTVQTLAYLSEEKLYPALLIVPPHLILNWEREINRFLRIPPTDTEIVDKLAERVARVHIIRGLKPYELPPADIYIIHYLLLRGWKNTLPQCQFRCAIFDEIQELRHTGTEKYSAASLLAEHCDNVIGLSGTPIYNKGGEIWNVMNILDYHCLGDWDGFTREWCYGYGKEVVINPTLLGEYLKQEGLLFRRTKEQVLKELPPKRRLVQEIDADAKVYNTLMESVYEKVRQWDATEDNLEKGRLSEQISQEERQATGVAKAPYVCAFVKALLEGEEKVLLFAHHHKVFDLIKKEMKHFHPVFITGRENEKQKDDSINLFMEGKSNLCCVSLRAASGLNLQRASCVVFAELDWSPAVHSQAEDRAHRMGQQDSVLCYYLVSSRGSDQDIQETLGLKVSQFTGIMGDRIETEEERMLAQRDATQHIQKIIERLREKAKS